MSFLKKIQEKPVWVRKIILWGIVGIISIVLFVWWLLGALKQISQLRNEGIFDKLKFPSLQQEMDQMKQNPELIQKIQNIEEEAKKAQQKENQTVSPVAPPIITANPVSR